MPNPQTTLLYLVRHGATDANVRRPYVLQGRGIDLPLNETGRRQAACVGRLFRGQVIDAVYSSPMRRAVETAGAVANLHGLGVSVRDGLVECDVGRWEGLDWESIRGQHPEAYDDFQRDSGRNPYLGGESYGDVAVRARGELERLLEEYAGRAVVVVAHNVVNRALLATYLGLDLARAKDLQQANGGVNVLRRRDGRTDVLTLNSLFHLEDDLR